METKDDKGYDEEQEDHGEHVWRFALDPPSGSPDDDPLLEMVRTFLRDFLQIGFLTHGGTKVDIDGFAFTIDPETIHKLASAVGARNEHTPSRVGEGTTHPQRDDGRA